MLVILCKNMDGGSYWLAPFGCYGWWFVMLYFPHVLGYEWLARRGWTTSGRILRSMSKCVECG